MVPIAWTVGHHHALRTDKCLLASQKERVASENDERVLMAIAVAHCPHYGVQFHPESIGTSYGKKLIQNFQAITCKFNRHKVLPAIMEPPAPKKHAFVSEAEGWEGNLEVCFTERTITLDYQAFAALEQFSSKLMDFSFTRSSYLSIDP